MTKKNSLVETAGSAKKTRVRGIALVATAMLLVGGSGAFAYWTSNGGGTGSAKNGGGSALVLTASFADGLTPGASEPVTFTATNPGTSTVHLDTITSVVTTAPAGCLPADFTIAPVAFNVKLPGTPKNQTPVAVTLTPTGTLTFADTAANQDLCKNAIITLTLTSN